MLHMYKSHDRSSKFVEGEAYLVKNDLFDPCDPYMTFDAMLVMWHVALGGGCCDQVCYKIGFIESNTQIYWSSHELRKILGEMVRRAQYFSNSWGDQKNCVLDEKQNPILS